jgi:hypothetical protein
LVLSITGYSTTGDTYISKEFQEGNENFGDRQIIMVTSINKIGLFNFDFEVSENISMNPEMVENAYLELYAYEFEISQWNGTGAVTAYSVIDDWDENTVTWSTYPGYNPNIKGESKIGTPGGENRVTDSIVSFDVTNIIRDWARTEMESNHGIALVSYGAYGTFSSKEDTNTGAIEPRLRIELEDSNGNETEVIINNDGSDADTDNDDDFDDDTDDITTKEDIPIYSILLMIVGGGTMAFGYFRP